MFTLDLYKALKKVGIEDEDATNLVASIDDHITMRVEQATQPVLNKLDNVQGVLLAQIAAIGQVKTQTDAERDRRAQLVRWVIGTAIAVVPITLAVLKAFNLLH